MVQSCSPFISVGTLVGEPARAAMLLTLMDGCACTATELAHVAGITPQTASSHLRRLLDGGLLSVVSQGRHRYYRLASSEVADMLEGILRLTHAQAPTSPRAPSLPVALRTARSCYRHLAGRYAVAISDHLLRAKYVVPMVGHWQVSADGAAFLAELGQPLSDLLARPPAGKPFRHCRGCLDCTERRPHLAGKVGEAMLDTFLHNRWLRRVEGTRELLPTPPGRAAFLRVFQIQD